MNQNVFKRIPWLLAIFVGLGFPFIVLKDIIIFVGLGFPFDVLYLDIFSVLVLLLLVLRYASIVYRYVRLSSDVDSVEHYVESIYFLGFIFTLGSICWFLISFDFGISGSFEANLNKIIQLIGIKTSTTIAGLIARNTIRGIYITDYRKTEALQEMRELIKYAQEFTQVYGGLLKITSEYLAERRKEISDLSGKELAYANSLTQFSETALSFCGELKQQQQTLQQFLNTHKQTLQETTTLLNETVRGQQTAFDSSKKELRTFDKSVQDTVADLKKLDLEPVSKNIKAFTENVRSLSAVLDDFITIIEDKVSRLGNKERV